MGLTKECSDACRKVVTNSQEGLPAATCVACIYPKNCEHRCQVCKKRPKKERENNIACIACKHCQQQKKALYYRTLNEKSKHTIEGCVEAYFLGNLKGVHIWKKCLKNPKFKRTNLKSLVYLSRPCKNFCRRWVNKRGSADQQAINKSGCHACLSRENCWIQKINCDQCKLKRKNLDCQFTSNCIIAGRCQKEHDWDSVNPWCRKVCDHYARNDRQKIPGRFYNDMACYSCLSFDLCLQHCEKCSTLNNAKAPECRICRNCMQAF